MTRTKAPDRTATTTPEQDAPDAPARSLWASVWFVGSAVLVLLIVAAGIWLVIDEPDPAPTDQPSTSGQPVLPGGDGCGPDGTGSQVPPDQPPAASWQLIGSMAAPSSALAGPVDVTDDGINRCYAPDPTGALFAAANFVASTSDPRSRFYLYQSAAVPGVGRDQAMLAVALDDGTNTPGVQIAGYSFTSYEPGQAATVDLVLLYSGSLSHLPIQLTWQNGDWLVNLPPTGRLFEYLQPLTGMAGYVPWQGA